MKWLVPLILSLSSTSVFAQGKYTPIVITDEPKLEKVESESPTKKVIQTHIIAELGEKPRYKSVNKRVLSINLTEQVAGPNEGKLLADIAYIADPNMMGVIDRNGMVIDAMRVVKAITQDPKIKSHKVGILLLRPHVVPIGRDQPEQMIKIQISLQEVSSINWDQMDGAGFEKILTSKGTLSVSPYFVKNGGKFLVLKREQLDL